MQDWQPQARPIPSEIDRMEEARSRRSRPRSTTSPNELAEKYGYQAKTLDGGYNRSALEELIRWRLWKRTGGGLMAELGSHQLDASSIFITALRPDGRKAQAALGRRRRRPAHLPRRPRVRRPRLLHVRVPRPGLLRRRRRATRSPTRTRRSSSPTRRSTATASAATAKS